MIESGKGFVVAIICIAGLIYVSYSNALKNDFVFDDHLAIVNNRDTTSDSQWSDLFFHDIWGKNLTAIDSHRSYRPLLIILFKILRSSFGLNPQVFRVVSFSSHFIVSLLVYQLGITISESYFVGFASSMFFASHPIHIEAVTAVVNIAESLAALPCLIAYLIFFRQLSISSSCLKSTNLSILLYLTCFLLIIVAM